MATSNISHVKIFNNDLLITVEGKIYIVNQSNFDIENLPSTISIDKIHNNIIINYENNIRFSHDQNKLDIYLKNVSLRSGGLL